MNNSYKNLLAIALIVFQSSQGALSQKFDGVYRGKVDNKEVVVELKRNDNLVIGVVYRKLNDKWFFSGTSYGSNFEGYSNIGLGSDTYIKGVFSNDSLHINIIKQDSTYEGKLGWVAKKGVSSIVEQTFTEAEFHDQHLVGEWILIKRDGPNSSKFLNWHCTYLENGLIEPDYNYINDYFKIVQEKFGKKIHLPKIKVECTWQTNGNKMIEKCQSEFGHEEFIFTYETRGDTLLRVNSNNYTEVFVRANSKKK